MAVVPAVSVCPTCAVPVIVGAPVAGVLVKVELLVTAGTPLMPVVIGGVVAGGVLDGGGVVAARGVGVGDDDGLALGGCQEGDRRLDGVTVGARARRAYAPSGTRTLDKYTGLENHGAGQLPSRQP